MRKQQIAFIFILTHVWVVMIFSGGLVFDTLIVYPNVFYDVPRSLDTAMAFAVVRGPSDFFPPVGTLALLTGIGTLILGWRVKSARYRILGSVTVILVGELKFYRHSIASRAPASRILPPGRCLLGLEQFQRVSGIGTSFICHQCVLEG